MLNTVYARIWAIGIAGLVAISANAETARTIAVGPFSAPESLRQVGASMPDLLTVQLSQQENFRVVEREKVTAIWDELKLSASGAVTPQSVAHLGQVLACDWLVTGTVVSGKTSAQVWTKVIDVKSGVVLDMQALPFDAANLPATVQGIAGFLAKVSAHSQADRFVTLGRFTDLSADTSREDWSGRLRTLIEQHCRDAHMGVVEREAVTPIFEEFQFQQAGLTGAATNQVRLQPAFWIVDGACKWVNDTQLNVKLRMHKVGGKEQVIELIQNAGPQLERAVLAAIHPILAQTGETTTAQTSLNEGKIHASRGMEAAANNDRFSRFHNIAPNEPASSSPQRTRDFQDNRRATLESFQKALLLNPKNVQAKFMLGYGLLGDPDPAQRERGKEFLKEVVALNDPAFSKRAAFNLEHADRFVQNVPPPKAKAEFVPEQVRAKMALEAFEKAYQLNPADLQAKFKYSYALSFGSSDDERKRGNEMLKEVVAANDGHYSAIAASRLAQVEYERRIHILQQSFSKFVPMEFEATTNGEAKMKVLHVKENLFEYDGHFVCGFQFTIPQWLDGDFVCMHVLAKTETNKDLTIGDMQWHLILKDGMSWGFDDVQQDSVDKHPGLKQRFPFTHSMFVQKVEKKLLEPGKTYAIWFSFVDQNVCDIAVAMTIDSERGKKEFGMLPLQ